MRVFALVSSEDALSDAKHAAFEEVFGSGGQHAPPRVITPTPPAADFSREALAAAGYPHASAGYHPHAPRADAASNRHTASLAQVTPGQAGVQASGPAPKQGGGVSIGRTVHSHTRAAAAASMRALGHARPLEP